MTMPPARHDNGVFVTAFAETLQGLSAYWHDVDTKHGANAHLAFIEGGVFATSLREYSGREAIQEFYRARHGKGPRVSRHLVTNLRMEMIEPERRNWRWILILHAADGEAILPSEPAIMIADVEDEAVRDSDGVWRLKSRRITPQFKSSTPTTG